MEPTLRGIIEKVIDEELSEDKLSSNYGVFAEFRNRGLLDSVPSAMFGRIYMRAYSSWLNYKDEHGGEISPEEAMEFVRIFEKRAIEIKSKISEIASL
jgi:hypothetical protein